MLKILSKTVITLCLSISVAIATEEIHLAGDFHEHYSQEVPVSGNVIAGIALYSNAQIDDIFVPQVFVPKSLSGEQFLCFQVLSRDGTYNSKNTYQIPMGLSGDNLLVDYSHSQHQKFLNQEVSIDAVAVKVNLGQCSKSSESQYLASKLSKSSGEDTHLRIYIDSLGATDVKLAARDQKKKVYKSDCKMLQGARLTGFDYVCTLELSEAERSTLDVRIVRFKHKRKLDRVDIKVFL